MPAIIEMPTINDAMSEILEKALESHKKKFMKEITEVKPFPIIRRTPSQFLASQNYEKYNSVFKKNKVGIPGELTIVYFDYKPIEEPMIILNCPDCKKDFEYKGRYDENTNDPTGCPHCYWVASKWTFEYVRTIGEEDGQKDRQTKDN
jgi:hypothetical protein